MADGIVEDLNERVYELERTIIKLCARSGHQFEQATYRLCGRGVHRDRKPQSSTSCDICGVFQCCVEAGD